MYKLIRAGLIVGVLAAALLAPEARGDDTQGEAVASGQRQQRPEFPEERRRRSKAALGVTPPVPGALSASTVAANPSPQALPSADVVLSIDGDFDLGRYVFQDGTPFIHNHGGSDYNNTAVGLDALTSATPGVPMYYGAHNTALGFEAATNTTSGHLNTAVGSKALAYNTTGYSNTAIGAYAGNLWTTGFDNIAIGSGAYGYSGDTGTIRIGGSERQSATYIEGIRGVTTGAANAMPVLVDSNGQLGTVSSSAAVKEQIQDLGGRSERLLDLRPVAFRYKKRFEGGVKPIQFGLVAEEVAEVFPELVVLDEDGNPETVKYHWLSTLLLNELQKEKAEIDDLQQQVAELSKVVAGLREKE